MERKTILEILKQVDEKLDEVKDNLYPRIGDPAHDIGDSSTALELFSNLSEDYWDEETHLEFIEALTEALNENNLKVLITEITQIFDFFQQIDDEDWLKFQKEFDEVTHGN